MVEIITKELTNRGRTEHEYKGTVKLEDVAQKKAIIDLLDRNNFGGYVEVRETEEKISILLMQQFILTNI